MSQKLFDAALRRAIAQGGGEQLRQAAENLLISAASGVPWALQMLADRLDGKPKQQVDVNQTIRKISEYSDDELAAIAFGRSAGTAETQESASQSPGVH